MVILCRMNYLRKEEGLTSPQSSLIKKKFWASKLVCLVSENFPAKGLLIFHSFQSQSRCVLMPFVKLIVNARALPIARLGTQ